MAVIVADSLLEVKDSITEAPKTENLKLQQKVETLENRISEPESDLNKNDQYIQLKEQHGESGNTIRYW